MISLLLLKQNIMSFLASLTGRDQYDKQESQSNNDELWRIST